MNCALFVCWTTLRITLRLVLLFQCIKGNNAQSEEEVEEFVPLVSALLINIGTLSTPWIKSMHKAAAKALELGKVWVLDPVGVGATNIRTKTATDLVISHKPTVIRGNASESWLWPRTFAQD
ncbi:hypothetical protein OS493_035263 [Desmophyllum pertusum]|uniref:hydroxyethylthiazole kinase n=1 Tax=Desmophyllum pertusum TaxID=174260 RepID=A0A9W9Z6U7_9CNID|nr:hypothetical protein OS493_035263 [Desmophyllum pertusum]